MTNSYAFRLLKYRSVVSFACEQLIYIRILRYMHTTVETIHKDDVENVIRLIFESVQTIKNGETFSYFDA